MRRAGFVLWLVSLGVASSSLPAGAADTAGADQGHLVVLDAATGEPRWERAPTGGRFNQLLFGMPGRRVVLARESPCASDLTEADGRLVAFDAATGKRRWAVRGVRAVGKGGSSVPVAADAQGVVVVVAGRTVRGLRATTGDEVWRVPGGRHPFPQVSANAVFTTLERANRSAVLDARDRRTGERLFRFSSAGDPAESGYPVVLAADEHRVVVASGLYSGDARETGARPTTVSVLDVRTGHEQGRFTDDHLLDDWAGAVLTGDTLVNVEGRPNVLPTDPPQGTLIARHLPDGAVAWRVPADTVSPQSLYGVAWSSDPGAVIARTSNVGTMLALDVASGEERWRRDGGIYASADDGRLIVLAVPDSAAHVVESIEAQSGAVTWTSSVPDRIAHLAVNAAAYGDSVVLSNPCIAD